MFDSKEFEINGEKVELNDGEMQRVYSYYERESIKDIIRDVALEEFDIDTRCSERLTEKDIDYIAENIENDDRIYEKIRDMAYTQIANYVSID